MRLVTTCFFALVAGLALTQQKLPENFEKQVDEICKDWNIAKKPGGVVGVAIDGKLVFAKGYGLANLETKTPNTADTVMDVGSVSKQFTATCILLLEEEGKLKISDSIAKYVPEIPTFGKTVTIDHLLHMTSGLRDYLTLWILDGWNFVDARTPKDAIKTMSRQTGANSDPGVTWNYCNSGYMLLSQIVERVSGMSLANYADKYIFKPLNMTNTMLTEGSNNVVENRASSYMPSAIPNTFDVLFSALQVNGDGGVLTTLADLTKWHENFYANKLGKKSQSLIDKLLTTGKLNSGVDTKYACGLQLDEIAGQKRIQHGGNWLGFNAMTARFPEKHVSIFTLGNDGTNNSNPFNTKIAELVFGYKKEEKSERKEVETSADKLIDFPGSYALPDGRFATVTLEDKKLFVQVTGQPKFPLFAESDTKFFLKIVDAQIEFLRNAAGKVENALIRQGGRETQLERRTPFSPTIDQLKEIEGTYTSPEFDGVLRFAIENQKLILNFRGEKSEVTMSSSDKLTSGVMRLTVLRDTSGVMRCISVDMGRASGMKLYKS